MYKLPVSGGSWQESRPLMRLFGQRLVTGPGSTPAQRSLHPRHRRERHGFHGDVLHGPVCRRRSGLKERGRVCEEEERAKEREREK